MIDAGSDFQYIKDLGAGNFGVCQLMVDLVDGEHVAVKFLPRGHKIDRNVQRELLVHCQLQHPNIIGFKRVFLTPTHLGIVLQYAAGGELFERVKQAGHFPEDEARYFFQQLITGVRYCHRKNFAHRDLKLENTLLDASPAPLLKIADFGYCKDLVFDTPPKSTVGTPAYISPEVLGTNHQYDGKAADVWSCGVHLYVMLVGAYPFDDPRCPGNITTIVRNIKLANYQWPRTLHLSDEVKDLVNRILVPHSEQRITIDGIMQHPWYLKNLPDELRDDCRGLPCYQRCSQPKDEIKAILKRAKQI
eukprot:jgi/Ulvmu1/1701/UM116_0014.1